MDSLKKYPIHEIVKFKDFSLVSIDPDYIYESRIYIQKYNGMINLKVSRIENQMINIALVYAPIYGVDKMRIKAILRLVNKDEGRSKDYELHKEVNFHEHFNQQTMLAELVNEENGWLIDGALVLEFGACIEAVQEKDQIWRFNFWNPVYDQDNRTDVVTFPYKYGEVYSLKHMLAFHSPTLFLNMPTNRNSTIPFTNYNTSSIYYLEMVLQAAHGVRDKEDFAYWTKAMIQNARLLQLYNVVHYCQYQLIVFGNLFPIAENLEFAFEFNTRHYSIHLMKKLKSREELKEILEETDIQKMSGESMKQCARFFFDVEI